MRAAAITILFFVLAFPIESALAQTGLRVSDISIVGNDAFSESTIREQMETNSVSWFSQKILQDDPFILNPEILEADVRSIESFYQREGYLFVHVSPPELTADEEAGSVEVTIRITENAPVLVKEVAVSLQDVRQVDRRGTDSLLAFAQPTLVLKQKSVFRDANLNADRKTLLTTLANGGYPFAAANYTLDVDTADTAVSVSWTIMPGPSAVFGVTSVTGNDHVALDLVLSKLTFREGERYDASKLSASQTAVYDLGLFNVVAIRADLDDTTALGIPSKVTLKEAKRVKLLMGAGYGKDEKFRVTAELRLLDVIGDAARLTLELRRSALEPYSVKLTFIQPDFLFPDVTFSLIPTVRKETETAYSMKRAGSRISLDYPLFPHLRGSIGYGLEKVELDTTSIASTNSSSEVLDTYTKHGPTMSLLWSDAVPLFEPVRGTSASLRFTFSGVTESDPYHFSRTLLDLKRYDRLWEGTIIASRLAIGTIHSRDPGGFIPVEERFYAGGSNSNRGWARFQLGPTDPSGKPIGGSSLVDGSLEIRQHLSGQFACALFMDYSEVQEQPLTYTLAGLQFAAGFGLRYATAIGPIRFDIAKPVFEGDLPVQYVLSIGNAY
jgi:outer membrane protein insertion porin family